MSARSVLSLLTALAVTNAILLKGTVVTGLSADTTVIIRGFVCLLLTIIVSVAKRDPLFPRIWGPQAVRFAIVGLGMVAMTTAYAGMNASSVALVARLDVPLAILIGAPFGFSSSFPKRMCALLAAAGIAAMAVFLSDPSEHLPSYFFAVGGASAVAIGYVILRGTVRDETASLLSSVPALGSIAWGLVIGSLRNDLALSGRFAGVLLSASSGVCMFLMYRLNRIAIQRLPIGASELYTVAGALTLLPIERYLYGVEHSRVHIIAFLAAAVLIILPVIIDRSIYVARQA